MSISIYLILLIVLLIFNLVFWLLVIWFRILFNGDIGICGCCSDDLSVTDDDSSTTGHRNFGYVDNEDPVPTRQMPFSISEAIESPPSYEEALKFERFGFDIPTTHVSASASIPCSSSPSSHMSNHVVNHPHQESNSPTRVKVLSVSQSPPRINEVRSRSSTSGSFSYLTPILEEELDNTPVTVVIDCIGVQASKLLQNCDTKVDLTGGEQLNGQSKC